MGNRSWRSKPVAGRRHASASDAGPDPDGGHGALLGSEYDAFGYVLVEVSEEAGEPKLRITLRGNRDYALGANDPADVVDLFSLELPPSSSGSAVESAR